MTEKAPWIIIADFDREGTVVEKDTVTRKAFGVTVTVTKTVTQWRCAFCDTLFQRIEITSDDGGYSFEELGQRVGPCYDCRKHVCAKCETNNRQYHGFPETAGYYETGGTYCPECIDNNGAETTRRQALEKLTQEEREALGLCQ